MRTGMGTVVADVRALIADGGTAQFSNDALEAILDRSRREARYEPLQEVATIGPGGTVSYTIFDAPWGAWEGTAGLVTVDSSYGTVTPSAVDLMSGRFTFAAAPARPVMVTGWHYDRYEAAAEACEQWASSVKLRCDVADADQRLSLSQTYDHLSSMADRFRSMATQGGVISATMTRDDVNWFSRPEDRDLRNRRASRRW